MSGPQCCANPPTLSSSCGAGHVEEQFGGLKTYVSGLCDSKSAVILVCEVYGYEAPNLRKLADKIAVAGFFVVVPDFLHGDPYTQSVAIQDWLDIHGTDRGFEEAKPVIEALKGKGVTKIGAAGFCWGGKVVVELAKYGNIDAAVLVHPSFVTVEDIHGVKVPISVLGAEIDQRTPVELVKQFEVALNEKPEVESFVKIFPGLVHGWAVRYNEEDEVDAKAADEAHSDLLDWFVKHVK